MGSKYSHLSEAERLFIENQLRDGVSLAAIGRALHRHPSTICRERRRGYWQPFNRYLAQFGSRFYGSKRALAGSARRKLDPHMRNPAWKTVLFGLRQDWSPQQLCDRLNDGVLADSVVPAGLTCLSHETIYRSIFAMPPGQQRAALAKMLRRSRSGRRKPRHPRAKRRDVIRNISGLDLRPLAANYRLEPGHWEGDLIKGAHGRSVVGTLVDRYTRMTLLVKLRSACADEVRRAFHDRLRKLPGHMRKTLTYDRGTEMACHELFTASSGMPVFFCDPYSPWQRGTNENTNGLIRQYLPKGTDLSTRTQADLSFIEQRLNGRPRRVLQRKTPDEVYRVAVQQFAPA
jgi:transposase, IS30 family